MEEGKDLKYLLPRSQKTELRSTREFPGGIFQFIVYVEEKLSFRTGLL